MSHDQYQYPGLVEPLETAGETFRPDKWHLQSPDPVRTVPATLEYGGVLVEDVAEAAEEITLDKWLSHSPDPIRVLRVVDGVTANPVEQSLFTEPLLSDWWQPASERIHGRRPLVPEGAFGWHTETPSTIAIDWYRQPDEPVQQRRQAIADAGGMVFPPEQPLIQLPDPIRARLTTPTDAFAFVRVDDVADIVTDWITQASEPLRLPAPIPPQAFRFVPLGETVTDLFDEFIQLVISDPLEASFVSTMQYFGFVEIVTTPPPAVLLEPGLDSWQRPTIREGGTWRVRIDLRNDLDENDTVSSVAVYEITTTELSFTAVNPLTSAKRIGKWVVPAGKGIEFFVAGHRASQGTYRVKVIFSTAGGIVDKATQEDFLFDVIS